MMAPLISQHTLPLQAAASKERALLVLQGASANGSDLSIASSTASSNCTRLVFPVQLTNSTSRPGSFPGHVVFGRQQLYLPLPQPLLIVAPLLLSVASRQLNVSADPSAFAVGVQLSQPAAAQGVTVRLQLTDAAVRGMSSSQVMVTAALSTQPRHSNPTLQAAPATPKQLLCCVLCIIRAVSRPSMTQLTSKGCSVCM